MIFRSALLSVAFWSIFLAGLRVVGVPPESCGEDNRDAIEAAANDAVAWIIRNQQPDGTFVYEYNAETNELSPAYNNVRHAGVTQSLYQAAEKLGNADALAAGDRALGWMLRHTVKRHGWAALAPSGDDAELGASDLMLISLERRRAATGEQTYDELMRELARFIVELQRVDGGFYIGYDLQSDSPQREGTSKYYPGESLLGLAMLHNMFPAESWDEPARKAFGFIVSKRDDVEDIDFPPLADQWTAMAAGEMAPWGFTDEQEDYIHRLAGRFGLLVRTEAQRQGSWYGLAAKGRHARAAGSGTWLEGLTGLSRAAQQDARLSDLRQRLLDRAVCMSGIAAENQVSAEESSDYGRPDIAEGAWFIQGSTRMDDQQHMLSGLIQTLDAMPGRGTP
jgi:hypothetical protein